MELKNLFKNIISSNYNARLLSNYFQSLIFAMKFMMNCGFLIASMFTVWAIPIYMNNIIIMLSFCNFMYITVNNFPSKEKKKSEHFTKG